ncbi:MAG: DNA degradation protein EddB, partial [Myxococcota bacterium]
MSALRWIVRMSCVLAVAVTGQAARGAMALGACGAPATRVHAIQGAARSSPLIGEEHVVEAVVVGVFPGLGGFFVQEEDADADGDPLTSEGLFVFAGGHGAGLRAGDRARVRGRVAEFFGLTELSAVSGVRMCPPRGEGSSVSVQLPLTDPAEWERWEGMRVRVGPDLVATGLRNLGRFGEVELAAGERLWQPTHREAPGAPALALAARNERHRILLDDGSHGIRPEPTPYLDRADGGTLRVGDTVAELGGVLDFAFGRFRIQPTGPVRFRRGEPRPEMPPHVEGTLRLVAWNVANHMNGDGRGGGFPTRGP